MPSRARVQQLINYVEQGRIPEAIEEFYADDVVMQDNKGAPVAGKAANLQRERASFDAIAEIHEHRAASYVVDGDRAAIDWIFDFTMKDGRRFRMEQTAYQTWRGDRIARERFYYDSATLAA